MSRQGYFCVCDCLLSFEKVMLPVNIIAEKGHSDHLSLVDNAIYIYIIYFVYLAHIFWYIPCDICLICKIKDVNCEVFL